MDYTVVRKVLTDLGHSQKWLMSPEEGRPDIKSGLKQRP